MNKKIILLWGKLRRLYLVWLRPGYVRKQLALRENECARCGACCVLAFRCPFLVINGPGDTKCTIHDKRPRVCRKFPIDERDLDDRNLIMPDTPCGFRFKSEDASVDSGAGGTDGS